MSSPGHVFWLFGLSGAGKSTLAGELAAQLHRSVGAPLVLDGDALRAGLCHGLGFSDNERAENLRRAAEVARLGLASGLPVVASFITPLESHRRLVAGIIGRPQVSFIYLDAPLAVCQTRDVKGLYARAKQGQVAQMTGVSSGFEPPADCDLRIDTATEGVAASAGRLEAFARTRLPAAR